MKFLIDLGEYSNSDLVIVEADASRQEFLVKEFNVLAVGNDFVSTHAKDMTLQELIDESKPNDPGEVPTVQDSEKWFSKLLEWRQTLKGLDTAGYGLSDAENVEEYHELRLKDYQWQVERFEQWQERFKDLIKN